MLTFGQCQNLWAKCKDKNKGKPIANNTRLFKDNDQQFRIRLYNTDIILISSDNVYTLECRGWETVTTKSRMHEFSPIRIYQHKFIWYVVQPFETWNHKKNTKFFNGIRLNRSGHIIGNDIFSIVNSKYIRGAK